MRFQKTGKILGGAGGAVRGTTNKGSEELEPIIIWDRKLGSWDGSMVRNTEQNVIQRIFLKNTVPILCAVRKWLWNAGRWARVSTKVNDETRGRVLNGAAVREQTGKGATTAGRLRPSRTSGFSACQVLWLIVGRSASRTASSAPLPSCARPICHATLAFLIFRFVSSKNSYNINVFQEFL